MNDNDIKLLPLPEGYDKYDPPLLYDGQMFNERQMQNYARANVAHATAALQAENERMRAERDALAAALAATEAARDGYRDDARQLHAALVRMVAQYESEFDHEDTHKWRPEWLREALARTNALQEGGSDGYRRLLRTSE